MTIDDTVIVIVGTSPEIAYYIVVIPCIYDSILHILVSMGYDDRSRNAHNFVYLTVNF